MFIILQKSNLSCIKSEFEKQIIYSLHVASANNVPLWPNITNI